jgi:hypothetical protein
MGPPRTGIFWDRWLSAYYADRVLVTARALTLRARGPLPGDA